MVLVDDHSDGLNRSGLTDIPLTKHGEDVVRELGPKVVGPGSELDPSHRRSVSIGFAPDNCRPQLTSSPPAPLAELLDPDHIQVAFVSPRQRARKTFDLLFEEYGKAPHSVTDDDAREWDYGDVEGKTAGDFRNSKPEYKNWDMYVHILHLLLAGRGC